MQPKALTTHREAFACETKKETAASIIGDRLAKIESFANAIADRVEHDLNGVSSEPVPMPGEDCSGDRWMPPVFAGYRNSANGIEYALSRIASALDRLEV